MPGRNRPNVLSIHLRVPPVYNNAMVDRRSFLGIAGVAAAGAALSRAAARKPNFLVVLGDDMGFSDARCYGGDIDWLPAACGLRRAIPRPAAGLREVAC